MPAMRLRLRVHRNELPAVSTLWPIPDTQLKITVAQLLDQVNAIFPLESAVWGLEHYTVTVGGYECLHYHEVGNVCKDEDEVVIRPLQTAEVRARTLLGRDQITGDGRHLFDGIPFGRPLLRGVMRPDLWIPPRKKRRLELDDVPYAVVEVEALNEGALMRLEDADEGLDDEDSEEDGDFDLEEEEEKEEQSEESETSSSDSSSEDDDDEEDSSEEDSSGSGSSDSSDDDDSMSEASWDGIKSGPPTPPSRKAASLTALGSRMDLAGSQPKTRAQPGPSEHSHAAAGKQGRDAPQAALKRKEPSDEQTSIEGKDVGKPREGKSKTQERNARRRDSKKLAHLKEVGVLAATADLTTLHEWQGSNKRQKNVDQVEIQTPAADQPSEPAAATAEKDTSTETLGRSPENDDTQPESGTRQSIRSQRDSKSDAARIEEQRQQLLDQIASGGVEVTAKNSRKRAISEVDEDEGPEEMSTKQAPAEATSVTNQVTEQAAAPEMSVEPSANPKNTKALDMVPSSVARRSKLDLAGSKRLLFGSLGVRVPKTQEEKDALQKRLSDRAKLRAAPPVEGLAPNAGNKSGDNATADDEQRIEEEDPEAWREKIELTAVECCEEGVTLSTPPFPFYQRWDPQQRRKKSKARTGKAYMAQNKGQQKRGKASAANGEHVEYYDKYNQNGEGDALDYDDAVDDDEYWEEGALLDGEYDEEGNQDAAAQQLLDETAAQEPDDGFPTLPEDINSLASLAETDAQKDDFITYKELTCSAVTKWQPSMLTRTAQIQGNDEDGWSIKLAMRDVRPKEFDDDGKRVYSKFEMEGMSDNEDEDERVRTVQWSEMVEPRLLLRSEKAVDGA
ncbi:hypothetical protein LTR36_010388 [Oleoguttula mirabilis]|uniref:DUF7357 domain-containing protein n=1 Tax=Oleoguttula mirabilis TaxID=1507867 RepID=A0AAV9J492_9PEZI|nr:hypothetical protein LTR36_010388 [Oleoguttula mirabilis]